MKKTFESSVIGIDFDLNTLKMIEYQPKMNTILGTATQDFSNAVELNSQQLSDSIKKFILKHKKAEQSEMRLVLPAVSSILYSPILIRSAEVDEQIQWELQSYLNDDINLYHYNYQIFTDSSKLKWAMACVIRKELLEYYQTIFQFDNLPLTFVSNYNLGIINTLQFGKQDKKEISSFILVVQKYSVQLIFVEEFYIDRSYFYAIDLEQGTPEQLLEVIEKVAKIIHERGYNSEHRNLILAGNYATHQPLLDCLSDNVFTNIVPLDTFKNVSFLKNKKGMVDTVEFGPHYAAAFGISLS